MSLSPNLSATQNNNIAHNNSFIEVSNNLNRPLYAQVVYNVGAANGAGMNGFIIASDTQARYGHFSIVKPIGSADNNSQFNVTFTSLTSIDGIIFNGTFTIPAGDALYNVKGFKLSNGHSAIGYYA
jgi:hypothetical protein